MQAPSRRPYYVVLGVLLMLTYATIQIAFIDLGPLNLAAALTIAVVKATVVALFFMHLNSSTGLTRVVVAGAIVWLLIMMTLTLSDYLTRGWRTYG
jgi:cytochrome c oxidase subunit 4